MQDEFVRRTENVNNATKQEIGVKGGLIEQAMIMTEEANLYI